MAFDQKTRNLLQRTVTACRRVLDREFTAQLQELYGIQPDGSLTPITALDHLGDEELAVARLLRERINHLEGGSADAALARTVAKPEHIARVIREQAFTVLNRLAALRLCEERGLVLECVRKGVNSEGFQLFTSSAGNALGETHEAYRTYLHCLFDELAIDLGVLFDRFSPLALLFPRHAALTEVLSELNGTGKAAEREELPPEQFAQIWQADETIGWIYQYYNDETERKKMRDESAAPRNSRELAVRNQFFTPRYVVEFLTDNTLGRIWYEMSGGATSLKEKCRYLVRRPNEIFLKPGEAPPSNSSNPQSAIANPQSQEELLRAPVFIPHRPLKDPRTILMLDPACGSMHFGLYAFDLFEVIYQEAWDNHPELLQDLRAQLSSPSPPAGAAGEASAKMEHLPGRGEVGRPSTLNSQPSTPEEARRAFLRLVPKLIIEHNLHGIDIDPRCAQIAGLSLWLRAQRAWKDMGLAPAQRPAIKRSNIVCAEPMPGEKELLREFVEREFPAAERAVCLRLLEAIFDKMQLAGEAGSLLKIEEDIRSAIEDARDAWQKLATKPPELFTTTELNPISTAPELTGLEPAVSSLTPDPRHLTTDFWERIEERIYAALRDYAEQAENGGGFQRRLFAEDAARGFAFIDVCRKRYDVALMNPPFGESAARVLAFLETNYPLWNSNLLCAFIGRAQQLLNKAGSVGAIFDKTALVKSSYENFREAHLFSHYRPSALVDLGWGVLDTAQVETNLATWTEGYKGDAWMGKVGGANSNRNEEFLLAECERMQLGKAGARTRTISIECIRTFPNQSVPFDAKDWLIGLVARSTHFELEVGKAMVGCQIKADVNFRVFWELPATESIGVGNTWSAMFNGGEFSPFVAPIRDVVRFGQLGNAVPFHKSNHLTNLTWQQKPGFGWGKRGDFVDTQIMPAGCVFTIEGQALPSPEKRLWPLTLLNSRLFWYLMNAFCGQHKYAGYVNVCPVPTISDETIAVLEQMAARICGLIRPQFTSDETAREFVSLGCFTNFDNVEELLSSRRETHLQLSDQIEQTYREINQEVYGWFGVGEAGIADSEAFSANAPTITASLQLLLPNEELGRSFTDETMSYALGVAFGRWDIRYATGEQAAPELPDPFAPLPICPPGQLQNAQGLSARPEDVPAAYPVRIPWDGILVDDPNHPLDIERRVREVIEIIWSGTATSPRAGGPTAEAIEHEACEILGVKSLRDYFRKPAGFFADHLKRYSKVPRHFPWLRAILLSN